MPRCVPKRVAVGLLVVFGTFLGCHDGPMYALKRANPIFSMGQWKADERLGPTDAQRAEQLQTLMAQIDRMPADQQQRWISELAKVMEHDNSPYMRGLAVRAAGRASVAEAISVIQSGLDDDHFKVRMVAASALSGRPEPEAIDLLAKTFNSDENKDVRLAVVKSLGTHRGTKVNDVLRIALKEPDLAFRHAAIESLKDITGEDLGDQPAAWVAMLDGEPLDSTNVQEQNTQRNRFFGNLF